MLGRPQPRLYSPGNASGAPFAPSAGLTPSQFGVLESLYHLGPMMPSQIADKHLKSRNNFTVVIDNLEKQGLVRRERCQADRRVVWVHLSEAGRARIEELFPRFVRVVVEDLQSRTREEQEQLGALLPRLGRSLNAGSGAPP